MYNMYTYKHSKNNRGYAVYTVKGSYSMSFKVENVQERLI